MGIDEALKREIVRRVLTVSQPDRIILFGSAATGGMNEDSDIDLLVLEQAPENTVEESVRIRSSLRGLGHPNDVIVISTPQFEETKDLFGGIAYPAHKFGTVLYEASGSRAA